MAAFCFPITAGRVSVRPKPGFVERRAVAEVRARAERLALRGEHDSADIAVLVEGLERVGDRVDQHDVEEVVRRALDLDGRDMAGNIDADVPVFSHVAYPLKAARAMR